MQAGATFTPTEHDGDMKMRLRNSTAAVLALVAILALAACGRSSNVSTESGGGTNALPQSGNVLVAAGTTFYGKLQQPISSKTSHNGDAFQLQQTDTLMHKNPALHGAVIDGHLDNVQAAGPLRKPGMTLVFDDIRMPDGTKAPVDVQLVSAHAFDARSHRLRTLGLMIGGAIAGHEMRKHSGHGGGMLGAAGGYVLSQTLKTDISVPAGTVVELRFKTPVMAAATPAQ